MKASIFLDLDKKRHLIKVTCVTSNNDVLLSEFATPNGGFGSTSLLINMEKLITKCIDKVSNKFEDELRKG